MTQDDFMNGDFSISDRVSVSALELMAYITKAERNLVKIRELEETIEAQNNKMLALKAKIASLEVKELYSLDKLA